LLAGFELSGLPPWRRPLRTLAPGRRGDRPGGPRTGRGPEVGDGYAHNRAPLPGAGDPERALGPSCAAATRAAGRANARTSRALAAPGGLSPGGARACRDALLC